MPSLLPLLPLLSLLLLLLLLPSILLLLLVLRLCLLILALVRACRKDGRRMTSGWLRSERWLWIRRRIIRKSAGRALILCPQLLLLPTTETSEGVGVFIAISCG